MSTPTPQLSEEFPLPSFTLPRKFRADLIWALSSLLRNGPLMPGIGICGNVLELLSPRWEGRCPDFAVLAHLDPMCVICFLAQTWPERASPRNIPPWELTSCKFEFYPVPNSAREPRWQGEQLRLRHSLINHCLSILQEPTV